VQAALTELVPRLVLDEERNELLHRCIGESLRLGIDDLLDVAWFGWMPMLVDQLILEPCLDGLDAPVVRGLLVHACGVTRQRVAGA
jgi:hypothetical protein